MSASDGRIPDEHLAAASEPPRDPTAAELQERLLTAVGLTRAEIGVRELDHVEREAFSRPRTGYQRMLLVRAARALAQRAHQGQTDHAGLPYFDVHVADVAYRVHKLGPLAEAVAYLHDVIEDTEVTLDELATVFPPEIVDAVDAITRRAGESKDDYYGRVAANPLAALVKLEGDIPSNTDPERMALLPAETRDRLERKYADAVLAIRAKMPAGPLHRPEVFLP